MRLADHQVEMLRELVARLADADERGDRAAAAAGLTGRDAFPYKYGWMKAEAERAGIDVAAVLAAAAALPKRRRKRAAEHLDEPDDYDFRNGMSAESVRRLQTGSES